MKSYILHIGYSKTGTSAIQQYLSRNRELLKKQKILYPDVKLYGVWAHCQNHNMLGRALAGRLGWYGLTPREYFEQFENQSSENNFEKVILSAESFLGGVQPWDYESEDQYWDASEKFIKELGSSLSQHDVKIIIYLRRQDHWLESALNQTIKFGGLMPEKLRSANIEELVNIYKPRLDYWRVLEEYSSVFGKDSIIVRVYEKDQLKNSDVVIDFLETTGINQEGLSVIDTDPIAENKQLCRDILEVKRILNKISRPKYQERVIAGYLQLISKEIKLSCERVPLLDLKVSMDILESCADNNKKIAVEYLGRDDKNLFFETVNLLTDQNKKYAGLSTEAALEVFLRLDRYMQSNKGKLQLFRHWGAEIMRCNAPQIHALFRMVYTVFRH